MKRAGFYPPFFLFSNEKIEIGKFDRYIYANLVFKELPKDTAYLITRENIPHEYEWAIYNDCPHTPRMWYKGECKKCHEDEKQRKIKWEIEDKRIGALLGRCRSEGHKSLRDMLNHDCK